MTGRSAPRAGRGPVVGAVAVVALLAGAGPGLGSAATIVECVDARGVAVLSSGSSGYACLNGRPTARSQPAERTSGAPRAAGPPDFPRVDAATQRARDGDRARILRDELASEEGRLALLESSPRPRAGDAVAGWPSSGSTNAVADQLARTRENIRALQRELAGLP